MLELQILSEAEGEWRRTSGGAPRSLLETALGVCGGYTQGETHIHWPGVTELLCPRDPGQITGLGVGLKAGPRLQ